jgi:murein L,D-transpeptidase YcbB/YkuD
MQSRFLTFLVFITLIVSLPVVCNASKIVEHLDSETSEHIQTLLQSRETTSAPLIGVARLFSHEQILALYEQRGFTPVWLDGWELKPEAIVLMETLRSAGGHGLCSNDYLLVQLEGLIRIQEDFSKHNLPLAPDNRAVLDLFLSQAFLTFATHMVEGQVDPSLTHVDWSARRRKANLIKLLEYAISEQRMAQVIEGLFPPHKGYRDLVGVLARYRQVSAEGGWPQIPRGATIRPGDKDSRVSAIRALLRKTGDLSGEAGTTNFYDSATEDALRSFQLRHGLVDDGAIGPKTLSTLNISVEERIRQIELNLERWRWMPKSFGKRYIRVNVADFSLEVVEGDEVMMQMPVIVGTQYRKTPVFSARMTYLEFAPYWTVPPTILREDKLPKIKNDPEYITEKNYKIVSREDRDVMIDPQEVDWKNVEAVDFPGLLRMEPGPWNPLGRVKFMFPNRFNVYLHDTNERYLFGNNIRSFSSGCIRVKEPGALADYLLRDDLDEGRLQELFAATVPEQISIRPIPVHIQYWTAWVGEDGQVNFRPDVYFRDLDLEVALTDPAYRVIDQLKVSSGTHLAQAN